MLESKKKWLRIEHLLTKIMRCREEEERRVHTVEEVETKLRIASPDWLVLDTGS